MSAQILETIQNLRNKINHHAHLYYVLDSPELSDTDYDMMFSELLELEAKYPEHFDENSPTQRVGGQILEELEAAPLDTPMYSLDNAFNLNEAEAEIKKMCSSAGLPFLDGSLDLIVEPKLDGLALEHTYVNQKLVASKTRGDKLVGELVTASARTIVSLPLTLSENASQLSLIQVRGEAFMPHKSLDDFNDYAKNNGLKPLSNCRNGASGAIRQLDSSKAAKRKLEFMPYSLANIEGDTSLIPDSQFEMLQVLKGFGFKINPYIKKISSIEELRNYYDEILKVRPNLGYDIDGIVIKLDSRKAQEEAGNTSRAAKYAIALKLPPEEAVATLLSVDLEVGKTGQITPTGNISSTKVGGVTISRVSLHNFDKIKEKDIAIGDDAVVFRAGDVVPTLGKCVRRDEKNRVIIQEPTHCPCCGSPTKREVDDKGEVGAILYCTGGVNCDSQALSALIQFASKPCMNFNGVGESLIQMLYQSGAIKTYSDYFKLTVDDLIALPRMGAKSAQKAIDSINKAKHTSAYRLISGLNIRGIGESRAKNLANHFESFDDFKDTSYGELIEITDIGDSNAYSIVEWLGNEANINELNALLLAGLTFEARVVGGDTLKGQTWVLTGTLSTMKRSQAKSLLEGLGAKVSGSVSSKTSGLLYGSDAGGKLSSALAIRDSGGAIDILSEDEFIEKFSLSI